MCIFRLLVERSCLVINRVGFNGFYAILRREVWRFWSIKRQTLLGPLLETYLYISVFGAALGTRIDSINGSSYVAFIIPGLLLMSMAMNAFSNNASSLLQQKVMRAIDDQLTSPVPNGAMMLAFTLGGFIRGLLISTITFITASLLIDLPIAHPFILVSSMMLSGMLFASLGVFIGIRAENFDGISFYQTFVIQPLIFLGGIFYTVSSLPEPFKTLTHFNPVFYMINTVRYGMLGTADTGPYAALIVLAFAVAAMLFINWRLFQSGHRLRS